jgi:tetratricopeptide (TPR) repeat protein
MAQPSILVVPFGLILGVLAWGATPVQAPQGAAPAQPNPAAGSSGTGQQAPEGAPAGQAPRPQGGGAAPSEDAFKYGSPPVLAQGTTEEQMWPAASAEGWAKPCLIPWQRSFHDALAVSKSTGAPILVCVNMDGEIASEHFAGVRYRDPATAKLLERYVCVIASVYRHTPRDYDEQGRRVPCPRFGTVTCGEHIACEVELYAKYFEGKRISPRHIMLDLSGSKSYDVYYSWDTETVFTAYAKGVENLPLPQKPLRDGVPMPDRVASADAADRAAVERAYAEGDHGARLAILRATLRHRGVEQNDLLRLAVFGLDVELARVARQALAQSESEGSIDVIAEALKVPLDPAEREALVNAAARLGEKYPRARTLAALHQGMQLQSSHISSTAALDTRASEAEYSASAATMGQRGLAAEQRPADPAAKLEFAEALLARVGSEVHDPLWTKALLEDARLHAEAAERLGQKGWRVDATLAAAYGELGLDELARERAVRAVEGGMWGTQNPEVGTTDFVKVRVLALFAQARQQAIRKAYQEKSPWPPEWLADVNAAYARLAAHPLVTEDNLVSYYDFLSWLGGTRRASALLEDALRRFPDSGVLHDRLRGRLLWEKGPAELEADYARRLAEPAPSLQLTWFAGYASLVAAEQYRRRNSPSEALAAYERGIALYERSLAQVPEGREDCDHFIALARAGRARVMIERGELEQATRELLAGLERRPASTGTLDGLNWTPGMTAKLLHARLLEDSKPELAGKLKAAMDGLDSKLLEEPDFAGTRQGPRGGRGRR